METVTAPSPESTPSPPDNSPPPDDLYPPPAAQSPPPPTSSPPPPVLVASPPPPPVKTVPSPPPPTTVPSPPPPEASSNSPPPPEDDDDPQPPPSPPVSSDTPDPVLTPSPPTPSTVVNSPPAPKSSRQGGGGGAKALTPPSTKSKPKESSSTDDSAGIALGVTFAVIVIISMVIFCVVCLARKNKKRKRPYFDPPRAAAVAGGGVGGGQGTKNKWNKGGKTDNRGVVKLPLPPGQSLPSSDFSSGFSGGPLNNNMGTSTPMSPSMGGAFGGLNTSSFSYEELVTATSGFSQANLIGQGGFGYVYKGVMPSGKEVAVKSLKSGSGQGEREFQAEVEIISRVHHRHLVSLVGYCIADGQRMLVYEFVPNNTLEYHLHGSDLPTMEWGTRMRIALGSAKGLAYLHEDCHPRIIHRDIKAANILLDYNFEAMVADFGLAKLTTDNFTHVSTRVMGTFGYLAPEYASSGKLSDKSDVFSFGVMLLELITGRRPVDPTSRLMEDSLVDWARPLLSRALEDGNYDELADPRLQGNFDRNEMARIAACTSTSIRHSARRRPKMSQVVRALEGSSSLDDLIDGPKASSQVSHGSSRTVTESSMYDTGAYNADMMKFRKMVLMDETQEYSTSDD